MASAKVFDTKSFCVVTGASRGIGRAVTIALSVKLAAGSVLVITGRTAADLDATKRLVQACAPGVNVKVITADLASEAAWGNFLSSLDEEINRELSADFQHALLINNAGSLGPVSHYLRQYNTSDVDFVQQYFMLNVTSPMLLTSHFLKTFLKRDGLRRTIVNISSLAAIKPLNTCFLYCTGKAARDMMLQVAASEEPDVRALNYSPGPVETAMFHAFCQTADEGLKESMAGTVKSNSVLQPEQTASVLLRLLEEDKFESGAHIDYFDVPQ